MLCDQVDVVVGLYDIEYPHNVLVAQLLEDLDLPSHRLLSLRLFDLPLFVDLYGYFLVVRGIKTHSD